MGSSDESDVEPSQSNATGLELGSNEIESIISDTVQYVITSSQKKLPIKKQNLSKSCLRGRGRQFKSIFDSVNLNLDKYFGMKLVEVTITNSKVQQYILVNNLGITPSVEKSAEDHLMNGILLPVLAVIFMLKGQVKEDVIWNFLKTLGFDIDSNKKLSPLNYTLKQLMTNIWVKQLYLEYNKVAENDDPHNVFDWGFRASQEVDKMALLTYVPSIYDPEVSPETWHEQYALAQNQRNGETL